MERLEGKLLRRASERRYRIRPQGRRLRRLFDGAEPERRPRAGGRRKRRPDKLTRHSRMSEAHQLELAAIGEGDENP